MILNENDDIVLEIKRLGINGEGIGFYQKLAVFVPNAIPGETVKCTITGVSEKMAKAEIKEIRVQSPNRVEPKCEYYGNCGGCQTQHIAYKYSLVLKREMVVEAITRYTKLNPKSFEIKPTIGMDNPYGYRNKSSLPVREMNEKSVVGIIDPDTRKIIYINDCPVQHPIINEVNNYTLSLIDKYGISTYHEYFKRGVIKFIVTRISTINNEVQVTIVINEKNPKIFELAKELIKYKNVVSVYENFNDSKKDGIIFGEEFKLLEGKEVITEQIGSYKYNLKPNAFFQLNPRQTEKLYDEVKKACKLSRTETVLDAYCGVGTIAIHLAKMAKEVVGIEYTKESVDNAISNAKLNKITNTKFYQGDVTEVLPKLISEGLALDIVVVDPPRTGLGEELINTLLETNVKRIVYVSCNPSTLGKDLNVLTEKYNVKFIQPVDMFPMTSHVETVVLLSRISSK